jgi:hypothetical protein
MMSVPRVPALQTRIDDFSYQVSSPVDPRFWFRLERKNDRDVITDYFLGAFPKERSAGLLAACYQALGLTPRMLIVFRNIVPSSGLAVHADALAEAQDMYSSCGKSLLMGSGARRVRVRLEEEHGKYDLVLTGES